MTLEMKLHYIRINNKVSYDFYISLHLSKNIIRQRHNRVSQMFTTKLFLGISWWHWVVHQFQRKISTVCIRRKHDIYLSLTCQEKDKDNKINAWSRRLMRACEIQIHANITSNERKIVILMLFERYCVFIIAL